MILEGYSDTTGWGMCRGCGARIQWIELTSTKKMPFDREIVPIRSRREPSTNRVILEIDTDINTVHWSTCTQPDQFRRKKR